MSLLPPISTKSVKFELPGSSVTGTLVEIGDEQQQTEYQKQTPAYWDDEKTRPKMQRRFILECTPDPAMPGDDGRRALYATVEGRDGSLYRAIYNVLEKATALGGTLSVTFTGTDPLSKNPANPRKLYSATYSDPTPGQILGGQQPAAADQQAAPATQAADAAEAPAGPPAGITAEAWDAMDSATQQAILAAQAPPF